MTESNKYICSNWKTCVKSVDPIRANCGYTQPTESLESLGMVRCHLLGGGVVSWVTMIKYEEPERSCDTCLNEPTRDTDCTGGDTCRYDGLKWWTSKDSKKRCETCKLAIPRDLGFFCDGGYGYNDHPNPCDKWTSDIEKSCDNCDPPNSVACSCCCGFYHWRPKQDTEKSCETCGTVPHLDVCAECHEDSTERLRWTPKTDEKDCKMKTSEREPGTSIKICNHCANRNIKCDDCDATYDRWKPNYPTEDTKNCDNCGETVINGQKICHGANSAFKCVNFSRWKPNKIIESPEQESSDRIEACINDECPCDLFDTSFDSNCAHWEDINECSSASFKPPKKILRLDIDFDTVHDVRLTFKDGIDSVFDNNILDCTDLRYSSEANTLNGLGYNCDIIEIDED